MEAAMKKYFSLLAVLGCLTMASAAFAQLPTNPWSPKPNDGYFEEVANKPAEEGVPTIPEYSGGQTNGEVLPVATRSFGAIGVFAIPEMGRFYRHVLIEGGYPHHGAVAFGHHGKALFEVFKYIGVPVDEIGYNQPAGVRYPTENPWG